MTTALYARYSSDLQSERSIDDQVEACKLYAARAGLAAPFAIYADAALSGATMATRPQLQALLADIRGRRVEVVLSESIDRLSRDQADVHLIRRACASNRVRLFTIADGEVTAMVAGLKGIIAEHFLADLAQKVRRGQMGVARSGRIAGGRCYGYKPVDGKPGERVIDEAEAAIVVRVFADYANGASPRTIARKLNAEGVAAPRGGLWRSSTLTGDPRVGDGLLGQELYRGRLVFNRRRFIKNAETGRRAGIVNPQAEWLTVEAPQLRIVEEKLWLRAAAKRAELAQAPSIRAQRRPRHLLSGLIRCAGCGGVFAIYAKSRVRCSNAHATGACDRLASVPMRTIEARVLAGLKRHLLAPDLIAEAVKGYHEELAHQRAQEGRRRGEIERGLAEARRRADRLAEAMIEGGGPTLKAKLAEAEAQIAALEAESSALPDDSVVPFHPAAADFYRARVAKLEEALAGSADLAALVRPLIARIDVEPDVAAPDGWAVVIQGQIAAILALGAETPPSEARGRSVLMGAGVHTHQHRTLTLPMVA